VVFGKTAVKELDTKKLVTGKMADFCIGAAYTDVTRSVQNSRDPFCNIGGKIGAN
jgi:hypothetical protein